MNDRVAASPHQFILKTGQKWRRRRGQEEERAGGERTGGGERRRNRWIQLSKSNHGGVFMKSLSWSIWHTKRSVTPGMSARMRWLISLQQSVWGGGKGRGGGGGVGGASAAGADGVRLKVIGCLGEWGCRCTSASGEGGVGDVGTTDCAWCCEEGPHLHGRHQTRKLNQTVLWISR